MSTNTIAPYTYTMQGGALYRVSKEGWIAAERNEWSGKWLCRGAVRFNNFGRQVEFVPFPRCFIERREWRYKNGKPRWFIADTDYGTNRVQMASVLRSYCEVQS